MKHYKRRCGSFFIAIMMVLTLVNAGHINIQANTANEKIINDMDTDKTMDFVTFEGNWVSSTNAADQYHNDEHYANSSEWTEGKEASYTITFTGNSIRLYGNKAPKLGDFKVWIDDKLIGTYSANSTARVTKQKIFESDSLPNGKHILKVKGVAGTGNVHFDYAAVTYEDIKEIGTCLVQSPDIKKGVVSEITLQLNDLKDAQVYRAGDFYVSYDQNVLHYVDSKLDDKNGILKVKDEGGKLHIVFTMKKGWYDDLTITLRMSGKKVVDATEIKVTKAIAADGAGTQASLKATSKSVAVLHDEQVEQAYNQLQSLINQSNQWIQNGALDHADALIAQLIRSSLDGSIAVLNNTAAQLNDYVTAWNTLSGAIHMLQSVDYKTKLNALIDEYEKLDMSIYEDEGSKQFQNILKQAKHVLAQENVSVSELMQTYDTLVKAKDVLVEKKPKPADKALLKAILKIAEQAESIAQRYDQNAPSWKVFISSIENARTVLNNASASQKEVDYATEQLTYAYENIRLKPDERMLAAVNDFINKASTLDSLAYTKENYNFILNVKQKAEKLYKDFSEEGYRAIEKDILKALDIMQNHRLPNKDKEQKVVVKTSADINTGDQTNNIILTFSMLILISGALILYLTHKRKNLKESTHT